MRIADSHRRVTSVAQGLDEEDSNKRSTANGRSPREQAKRKLLDVNHRHMREFLTEHQINPKWEAKKNKASAAAEGMQGYYFPKNCVCKAGYIVNFKCWCPNCVCPSLADRIKGRQPKNRQFLQSYGLVDYVKEMKKIDTLDNTLDNLSWMKAIEKKHDKEVFIKMMSNGEQRQYNNIRHFLFSISNDGAKVHTAISHAYFCHAYFCICCCCCCRFCTHSLHTGRLILA